MSLAQTAWKRRRSIFAVWLLVTAAAAAVVQVLPPMYQSEAVILLEAQRIPTNFVSPTVRADLTERLSSLQAQVLSHTHLSQMIETFGLYSEKAGAAAEETLVQRMRNDIHVKVEKGYANQPPAFRVGYTGAEPEVVAQVASRLAGLFIEQDLRQRQVEAASTASFLESQLEAARKSLEEQEARLSAYKKSHIGELPEQEGALLGRLSRLGQQLQSDRDAMQQAEQERSFAVAALEDATAAVRELKLLVSGEEPGQEEPGERLAGSAATGSVQRTDPRLAQLRERLSALKEQYTENHPDVVRARQALEEYRRGATDSGERRSGAEGRPSASDVGSEVQLDSRVASVLASDLLRRQEQVRDLRKRIAALDARIKNLSESQERVRREMARVEARVANLPIREQELAALVRDYEISKSNYQSLLRKKMDADLATAMERRQKSERFVLLDPPRVPKEPVRPQRLLLSLLGSGLGLVCGLLLAFGRELSENVFLGEWELPDDVEIVGRVPEFSVEPAKVTNRLFLGGA